MPVNGLVEEASPWGFLTRLLTVTIDSPLSVFLSRAGFMSMQLVHLHWAYLNSGVSGLV